MKKEELLKVTGVVFPSSNELQDGEEKQYNLNLGENPNFNVLPIERESGNFKLAFVNGTLSSNDGKKRAASILVNQDLLSVIESGNMAQTFGAVGVGKTAKSGKTYDQFTFRLDPFFE